jgi:hypothetical protein
MSVTMDPAELHAKAREAIRAGRLPTARPVHVWGGHGFGTGCAVCAGPIGGEEIGFELRFAADDGNGGEGEYYLHARCFAAWDDERQSLLLQGSNIGGTIFNRERHPDTDKPA